MSMLRSRRRSQPQMSRWARPAIGAIATAGAVITGYLTLIKFMGDSAACPTQGCEQVLNSPYATVFGQPLTLWGFLAYVAMAALALAPLVVRTQLKDDQWQQLEQKTAWLLLVGATAMVVFSGYLMYLLAFQIQAVCWYCLASALFSLSLWVLAVWGRSWPDIGQPAFTSFLVALVTLVGTVGIYSTVTAPSQSAATAGSELYPVTTTSGPAEIALAQHLSSIGAKMYGAYWCPACHSQKQLFGKQAFADITYIECAEEGGNSQRQLCQQAGIQRYPTWEINGQLYPGTRSLQELAQLSNYRGSRAFQ